MARAQALVQKPFERVSSAETVDNDGDEAGATDEDEDEDAEQTGEGVTPAPKPAARTLERKETQYFDVGASWHYGQSLYGPGCTRRSHGGHRACYHLRPWRHSAHACVPCAKAMLLSAAASRWHVQACCQQNSPACAMSQFSCMHRVMQGPAVPGHNQHQAATNPEGILWPLPAQCPSQA